MAEAVTADHFGPLLDSRRAEGDELMLGGIPAHLIADRYLIMGAQPYEVFTRLMNRLNVLKRA